MAARLEKLVKESSEKEKPQEFRPFTTQEKKALIGDGAFVLRLTGETIAGQKAAGRPFRWVGSSEERLLKVASIKTDVAIFPDPKKFFIPNSGNKDLLTQEELARKDGQELRKRLGLKEDSLDVIIPEQASTFTELIFKYLGETAQRGKGVWLLGQDYGYYRGITKNLIDESGSLVAIVGIARLGNSKGVLVDWYAEAPPPYGGRDYIRAVRLIVAKKK